MRRMAFAAAVLVCWAAAGRASDYGDAAPTIPPITVPMAAPDASTCGGGCAACGTHGGGCGTGSGKLWAWLSYRSAKTNCCECSGHCCGCRTPHLYLYFLNECKEGGGSQCAGCASGCAGGCGSNRDCGCGFGSAGHGVFGLATGNGLGYR